MSKGHRWASHVKWQVAPVGIQRGKREEKASPAVIPRGLMGPALQAIAGSANLYICSWPDGTLAYCQGDTLLPHQDCPDLELRKTRSWSKETSCSLSPSALFKWLFCGGPTDTEILQWKGSAYSAPWGGTSSKGLKYHLDLVISK